MRADIRCSLRGLVLSECYTARGSTRLTVDVPRRGPMRFALSEHERAVHLVVATADLHRVLCNLVDGPVERRDPDLPDRLLDAMVEALEEGRLPTTWGELRLWLDARGVPYVEHRGIGAAPG